MDITIARRETPEAVVLSVSGRLDAEHVGELARVVDEELRRGHHAIALDLSDCGFLSSAGIRVLFEIHRSAQGLGGQCLIRVASEPIRKVLELTRLAPILMESAAARTAPGPTAAQPPSSAVSERLAALGTGDRSDRSYLDFCRRGHRQSQRGRG
jgi:anti-sigma B factor antagonist